jgi:hypothetical protein
MYLMVNNFVSYDASSWLKVRESKLESLSLQCALYIWWNNFKKQCKRNDAWAFKSIFENQSSNFKLKKMLNNEKSCAIWILKVEILKLSLDKGWDWAISVSLGELKLKFDL